MASYLGFLCGHAARLWRYAWVLGISLWFGTSAAQFTEPVVVTDQDTAEPGIDLSADGAIYINAPVGLLSNLPGSPSFLFRSDDGGQTFIETNPDARSLFLGGGDSDVVLDSRGTIYFTDLYLVNSTVSVSNDRGNSWIANPVGGVVVQDRQWLSVTEVPETDSVTVYHVYNQLPLGILVTKSLDGGVTYVASSVAATPLDRNGFIGPPGTIVSEAVGARAMFPSLPECEDSQGSGLLGPLLGELGTPLDNELCQAGTLVDDVLSLDQRVGIIYANSTGGIGFARSTDGATTFTQSVVSPDVGGADTTRAFPVVARASQGHLVAVWLEVINNESSRVRFSRSDDFGANWSEPVTLVEEGTSVYPWVDASGDDVSVVLYQNPTAEATPDTAPEETEWFAAHLKSLDGGGTFSALTIVDPLPVKSGPVCTKGAACAEDRDLLDFLSVAVGKEDGRAHVTWTRVLDEQLGDTEIRFAREE